MTSLLATPAPKSACKAPTPLSADTTPFFPVGRSKALRWSEDCLGDDDSSPERDLLRRSSYRDVLLRAPRRVEPSVGPSLVSELPSHPATETVASAGDPVPPHHRRHRRRHCQRGGAHGAGAPDLVAHLP
ncbi:hypothetical protein BS78_06G084400 [Paspalum vaginatum]|nr:hypothetical protein BS78_06G084400 [Paspalum vaginatum]